MALSLEQLKKEIEDGGYNPSDLFGKEIIEADPIVDGLVKDGNKNISNQNRRLKQELQEANETHAKELETIKGQLRTAQIEAVQSRTSKIFDALATERKLDAPVRKYVESALEDLQITAVDEAGVKEQLGQFIDKHTKRFDLLREQFGAAKTDDSEDGDLKKSPPSHSTPPGDETKNDKNPPADKNDYTDPRNNPLIPSA